MRRNNILLGLIVLLISAMTYLSIKTNPETSNVYQSSQIIYSDFLASVHKNEITKVLVANDVTRITYTDGHSATTVLPYLSPEDTKTLLDHNVSIEFTNYSDWKSPIAKMLVQLAVMGLFILCIGFILSKVNSPFKGPVWDKKQKKITKVPTVSFNDVAGLGEIKDDVIEIVHFLKNQKAFQRFSAKIPRGILLHGNPGTGKTLLVKAVAGEAGVPFFYASGSDFDEIFVGMGASRVRELFEKANANSPAIIFIDEIDAVGTKRGVIGRDNQTLNQLLATMDGFVENNNVIVFAATNKVDDLDPALLRPGRFDRKLHVPIPDKTGRKEIVDILLKKVTHLAKPVTSDVLTSITPGFTGAQLAHLCNEAALLAVRHKQDVVEMSNFITAIENIVLGKQRTTLAMKEMDIANTAHHEAGHAIVCYYTDHTRQIFRVTITPRTNGALGMVWHVPKDDYDQVSMSKQDYLNRIDVLVAGRIGEELFLGSADKASSGASNDIMVATDLARDMVCQFGMGDRLGFVKYDQYKQSEQAKQMIEDEVRAIISSSIKRVTKLLKAKLKQWSLLAQALIRVGTMSGEEVTTLLHNYDTQVSKATN